MATAFVQEFAIVDGDTSTTNYDAIAAEIGRTAPAGLIVHTAGFDRDRGVFRIVDVWESREAGQRFMDETVTPLESGLGWTVELASGRDFVGKRALVEQKPRRTLTGLLLLDAGGVLRAHQKVHTAHGDGEITSGTFSPTMKQSIALARLPIEIAVGDTVHASVRDRQLAARVVKPPFVRHGKVLVA